MITITLFPDYGEGFPLQALEAPRPEFNDSIEMTTELSYGLSDTLIDALRVWRQEWYQNYLGGPLDLDGMNQWEGSFSTRAWDDKATLLGTCIAHECPGVLVISRHLFYLVSPLEWRTLRDQKTFPSWFVPERSATNGYRFGLAHLLRDRGLI